MPNPSISNQTEQRILASSGWALLVVFVITVLGGAFPLQLRDLDWSRNLSRLIVDAASLPLVGFCLIRYSTYLASRSLPRQTKVDSGASRRTSYRTQRSAVHRIRTLLRRLAIAGVVAMAMLALWQVPIFLRGLSTIDGGLTEATTSETQRYLSVKQALQAASPVDLQQGWTQLRRAQNESTPLQPPSTEQQRSELLVRAKADNRRVLANLDSQVSAARFALGRDLLRVFLCALVYAWAFSVFIRIS